MNTEFSWAIGTDIESIIAVNKKFSPDHEYDHPRSFIKESIEHKRILVSKKNDQITGYLLYQILWGNTPFLALIKILPDFQAQGLGSDLIKNFEIKIKADGFKKYISSTEKSNKAAQAFHMKNNFKNIGHLNMIYGEELFYSKKI